MSEMSGIFLSRTSSAIVSSKVALLTWYGSSWMMIAWRLPLMSSMSVFDWMRTEPRPVSK